MKKNTDELKKKREEKKAALKAKKAAIREKKRAVAQAKKQKILEKRKAKVAANKKKREEKKAKKLALLAKLKAKKAAIKAKKAVLRKKKLEKLAKKKAKEQALKLKLREKAKKQKLLEKQKLEKQKKLEKQNKLNALKTKTITIDDAIKTIKTYAKKLAKDALNLDDQQVKLLEKLGFAFVDDTITFNYKTKVKAKKQVAPVKQPKKPKPEIVDAPVAIDNPQPETIDDAIDATIGDKGDAIEALADDLEDDVGTETPVGDTFTDEVEVPDTNQPIDFEDGDDDTIIDSRDETDDDKIDFRRDWNNEFGDDGERDDS